MVMRPLSCAILPASRSSISTFGHAACAIDDAISFEHASATRVFKFDAEAITRLDDALAL